MQPTLINTNFDSLQLVKKGKVRDIYDLGDSLLMVATDRISAFDVVMSEPIPGKGMVLTQLSLFWFNIMSQIIKNHVITGDVDAYPPDCKPYEDTLKSRSMLVKKVEPFPIECVVRGYLSGSGWKSYQQTGMICGIKLPDGLKESDRLPEPIFTPSTKEEAGIHDVNIDFDEAAEMIGLAHAEQLRDLSIQIYKHGAEFADQHGIIIADTKFEFGLLEDEVILIDEVLTPDSSRFWLKHAYLPGSPQKSFDKQYLRDYLESIQWDKAPPAPPLPQDVIQNTHDKYIEALNLLTGLGSGNDRK